MFSQTIVASIPCLLKYQSLGLKDNNKKVTSLVVQWLRLHTPSAGSLGLIPGQGTINRPHLLQLRVQMLQLKILQAATKTWHSRVSK